MIDFDKLLHSVTYWLSYQERIEFHKNKVTKIDGIEGFLAQLDEPFSVHLLRLIDDKKLNEMR